MDEAAVARLLNAEGVKIICGGTTAQMAARVLGEELKVEWMPPSKRPQTAAAQEKGAPPMALLKGVDLVTEGILTLGQAVELLESAARRSTICRRTTTRRPGWRAFCSRPTTST